MTQSSKRTTTYKQRRKVKISGYTRKTGVKVRGYTAKRIKKVTRTITIKPRAKTKTVTTKAQTKRVKIRGKYRQITWINGKIAKNIAWKPTRKMYRISLAINYVIHGEYLSYRIQSWSTKKDFDTEALKEQLIRGLEKELGYSEANWWSDTKEAWYIDDLEGWKMGIEQPTKVTYDKTLIGKIEEENEPISQPTIRRDHQITEYQEAKK